LKHKKTPPKTKKTTTTKKTNRDLEGKIKFH
jgi:hypothetical protein